MVDELRRELDGARENGFWLAAQRDEAQRKLNNEMDWSDQLSTNLGALMAEHDEARAEIERLRAVIDAARAVAEILGECDHFAHHGYCQTHFISAPCEVATLRAALDSLSHSSQDTGDTR